MYTFRLNLDTHMVELLKDNYVEYEIPQDDFDRLAYQAYTLSKCPDAMQKVRNVIPVPLLAPPRDVPNKRGVPAPAWVSTVSKLAPPRIVPKD